MLGRIALLGLVAIGAALLGTGVYYIAVKIKKHIIAERLREEYEDAFKAEIKRRKENAVDVGIYDKDENKIADVTFESEQGVDASLRVGDMIYL